MSVWYYQVVGLIKTLYSEIPNKQNPLNTKHGLWSRLFLFLYKHTDGQGDNYIQCILNILFANV